MFRTYQVAVSTTATVLIIPYSDDRTAWHLMHHTAGGVIYFSSDNHDALTTGMILPTDLEHICNYHEGGDPRIAVYAQASGASAIACVREDMLDKKILEKSGYGT